MENKSKDHFERYKAIRNKIDKHVSALEKTHRKHLACKKGCDLCCMDYSIFPVEFYSIQHELKNREIPVQTNQEADEKSCVFLVDHSCAVYAERPVICRTHGLPLIFANDDGEFELSACELNFTNFDFEEFNMDNTFHQDKYNSMLFMLNREFVASLPENQFSEFDLIPIKKLAEAF